MKFGFDIDGVLVNDFDVDRVNVYHMLEVRTSAFPLFNPIQAVRHLPNAQVHLVTARPLQDRSTTFEWMQRHQLGHALWMAYTDRILSNKEAAVFKAETCENLGMDVFIESSKEQAMLIQDRCKAVTVIHFQDLLESMIFTASLKLREVHHL